METPQSEPPIDLDTLKLQVARRLQAEKRWSEAEPVRDQLMREAKQRGLTRSEAQLETYTKLNELFPPIPEPPETAAELPNDSQQTAETDRGDVANRTDERDDNHDNEVAEPSARTRSGDGTVRGLGDLPDHWPPLPPNASLGVETQWVLANRIRVVKETPDGIVVDLRKAITPAPSYATLGWLETSIRAFAKFVDVSAKASASGQDDADKVKRERLAIEEIRDLLGQMRAAVASK